MVSSTLKKDSGLKDRERKLAAALRRGDYVPPQRLADEMACTAGELEEAISSIREMGFEIEVHPVLGLRLAKGPDSLSADLIAEGLKTERMGKKILAHPKLTSTNEEAKVLGRGGAAEGTVVIADEQTQGRGRFGRSWYSPRGEGIWMSVILRPSFHLESYAAFSIVAAYAICCTLREVAGVRALTKWPNDVVVGDRKICGILAELDKDRDGGSFMVLGMGVNVNQSEFAGDLAGVATSIRIETGRESPRVPLIRGILENLERYYEKTTAEGLPEVLREVRQVCTLIGKQVVVSLGSERISGYVQDIDDAGRLIVRTEDGRIREVLAGEANAVR